MEQKELTHKWNEMGTDEPGLKTLTSGLTLSFVHLKINVDVSIAALDKHSSHFANKH